MVLNDSAIKARVTDDRLIEDHLPKNIRNCGYIMRVGRVFDPGSGQEVVLGDPNFGTRRVVWELGPSETIVVMTKESVRLPGDLCATYAPLHRHATNGLMLLNPAVIEPLYEGPLSCFLLNFSSKKVQISPDEEISKLIFHQLNAAPVEPRPLAIQRDTYQQTLSRAAAGYHRSFLDVTGIEERAAIKANAAVNTSLKTGGLIVALLLLWASLEPLASRWLWEKTGVMSATQRTENAKLLKDLEAARAMLLSTSELRTIQSRSATLEQDILELKRQLEALSQRGSRPPTR